jgi:large conductance mechanosensitive channel
MLKDFRDFMMKGNVLDLAVAVIMGAAFGAVVSSAVADVIMPPIGLVIGGLDFSALTVSLGEGADGTPVSINYGMFINKVVSLLIISLVLFLLIRAASRMAPKKPAAPAGPSEEVRLLSEIRDLLRK